MKKPTESRATRPSTAPPPSPEDLARARALIDANTWVFARTMPHCPHYYTLRKNWADDADFAWLVAFIRAHGFREKYGKSWYTSCVVDGQKYWTMGWPVEQTTIINRKPHPEVAPNTTPGLIQRLLFLFLAAAPAVPW
jgi:hypothetical protein